MPNCGSQCILCDVPIRIDTYKGCSHDCAYCFARKARDISIVEEGDSAEQLKKFIKGERTRRTNWCDWDIPLHWGGMSDPFQPCEKEYRYSYEFLKIFAKTQYPFIVSTKGKIIADPEYLALIEKCNCAVQISMVCSKYDKMELGCPTYEERLEILRKVSKVAKRTIVRIQPFMHEVFDDVYKNLERVKEAGAYGVIVEGIKMPNKVKGFVKVGGDFCYPYDLIKEDFCRLKQRAHELGLKIFAGENRLRKYGDSLCCCGVEGLDGFRVNTFNLNHIVNGDVMEPTECMNKVGTAECFSCLDQTAIGGRTIRKRSFAQQMKIYYSERLDSVNEMFGRKV